MTAGIAADQDRAGPRPGRLRVAHMLAVELAAVLVAVIIWAAAGPGAGIELTLGSGREVGFANVVGISGIVTAVGASALLALLRLTAQGRRTWTVLACVVLALSLLGPVGASSPAAWAVLTCMHLAVGAVTIVGLRAVSRDV